MTTRALCLSLLLTAAAGAAVTHAPGQDMAPPAPDEKSAPPPAATPVPADKTTVAESPPATADKPAVPKRQRAISSELAATLAVGMPKYSPPPPKPPEPVVEEDLPDMRDIDKPRNQIIRLPKVVVEGSRPPIFREHELYTSKALGQRLARRYYSEGYLAFSRFIHYTPLALFIPSAEASAMAQYYDEERQRNMADLNQAAADAAKAGDKAGSDYIRKATNDTFMHRMDWGWQGPKQ